MTERYGSGSGDEGHRPSGRGAVTERLARQAHGAREIDLTDEATTRADEDTSLAAAEDTDGAPAARDGAQADRESSGAFEPASPVAPTADAGDQPAEATRPESSSIFDLDERNQQEDQHPTGYEPPVADADADRSEEAGAESGEITPTPVPAAGAGGQTPVPEGLPEPPPPAATDTAAADTPAADTPAAEAEAAPAAEGTPAADGATGSPLGSLDVAAIRNRFVDIQAGFVDEPRQAVEEAGRFVDDLVQQVADALREQRGQLAGPDSSTEDLRLALRAYRQFVDRLLGLAS